MSRSQGRSILHYLADKRLPEDPDQEGASGIVRSALELAAEQAARGNHVIVASAEGGTGRRSWRGVELLGLPKANWARQHVGRLHLDLSSHMPLVRLSLQRRFDVVFGHGYGYFRWVRRAQGVYYVHSDPVDGPTALRQNDYRTISRTTDCRVAVSEFVARQLRQGFSPPIEVEVVRHGTSSPMPEKQAQDRSDLRSKWNLGDDDVVFLYVGAIIPRKGLLQLARAFRMVAAEIPNVRLHIAGSAGMWSPASDDVGDRTSYVSDIEAELGEFADAGHVRWLGELGTQHVQAAYAASDVVVVPSIKSEALSLAALDALAFGKPIVASRIGGLPEVVSGDVGFLVPPDNEECLAKRCSQLARSPALRERLAIAARRRATRFTWSRAVDRLDDILETKAQP